MKQKMKVLQAIAVIVSGFVLQSCLNTGNVDPNPYDLAPNGVVTVKTALDKTVYLQLTEDTTLLPVNLKKHPFDDQEVRALVSYKDDKSPHVGYTKAVYVNWIDPIPTKALVPSTEKNDEKYGREPLELVKDQITGVEDGYLTVRIRIFAGTPSMHTFYMVSGTNPDNPYELELRHKNNYDFGDRIMDGYIAFRLKDLPSTNGKTVKLTVKWLSTKGEQSHTFDYKTPDASPAL